MMQLGNTFQGKKCARCRQAIPMPRDDTYQSISKVDLRMPAVSSGFPALLQVITPSLPGKPWSKTPGSIRISCGLTKIGGLHCR